MRPALSPLLARRRVMIAPARTTIVLGINTHGPICQEAAHRARAVINRGQVIQRPADCWEEKSRYGDVQFTASAARTPLRERHNRRRRAFRFPCGRAR